MKSIFKIILAIIFIITCDHVIAQPGKIANIVKQPVHVRTITNVNTNAKIHANSNSVYGANSNSVYKVKEQPKKEEGKNVEAIKQKIKAKKERR